MSCLRSSPGSGHRRAAFMHRGDAELTLVACIRANLAALRGLGASGDPRARHQLRAAIRRDAQAIRFFRSHPERALQPVLSSLL